MLRLLKSSKALHFVGMQVIQESGGVWIDQPINTEKVLTKFGMCNAKPVDTPVDASRISVSCWKLLYLSSSTRPEITFADNNVAKVSGIPTKEHWTTVKMIFRYLKGTVNYGLQYSSDASEDCIGFYDAFWTGGTKDHCYYEYPAAAFTNTRVLLGTPRCS